MLIRSPEYVNPFRTTGLMFIKGAMPNDAIFAQYDVDTITHVANIKTMVHTTAGAQLPLRAARA
jgi:hypothetical protein